MANKIPIVIADFETQLSAAIAAGATSFVLASNTDDDGVTLPAGKYCFTVNNGSANKQYLIGQVNGVNVTAVVSVDRQGTETSGSQFAARAGSPVMISNFAALQRVADILRGQISLDGANPIEYDAEPTLADREQLATVGYVLDNVTGGTVTFNKQTIAGTAGETFSAGDFVYFNATDREWYALDASALASSANPKIGVALGDGSDGVAITGGIQVAGSYTTTGLTAGAVYFATDTAGAIGTSAGTFARRVGVALSTTVLYIDSSDERKSPRVSTETSSATPTINTDLVDVHQRLLHIQ